MYKLQCVLARQSLYIISNNQVTFAAQFIEKLNNTEAEFKKALLIKKRV